MQAEFFHCPQDHAHLPRQVILVLPHNKGKIQVAFVVIDRTAAGVPPHKLHAVLLHRVQVAFLPGVLVFADDDRILVDIEIQANILRREVFQKIGVRRQILPAVAAFAFIEINCHCRTLSLCGK